MNILILGGEGQLGSSISHLSEKENFANFKVTTIEQLDLSKEENIKIFLNNAEFDYLVNCTAYTAVDQAENDPDTAHLINTLAPKWIGKYSRQKKAGVIHVSTDYVFNGNSNLPLTPDMPTNPISVYGKTKLDGENQLRNENPNSLIVRTAWLYSIFGNNFLKTMLKLGNKKDNLKVVYDQVGSPTYAGDLANAIISILKCTKENHKRFVPGIYHYANEGVCSWYDFARMIFKLSNINCNVEAVRSSEFPTTAPRPAYSVMDKSKIKNQFNIDIPFWIDSLENCINQMKNK